MKRAWAVLLLAGCGGGGTSTSPGADGAELAMARGDLAGAEAALRRGSDVESRWRLARLLLMRNRPLEASELLAPLTAPKVVSVDQAFLLQQIWADLAAAYQRQDDWTGAARAWVRLQDPVLARKCDLLGKAGAYRIDAGWTDSILELQAVEPLPLLPARVNGRAGLFAVDTGGGELVLDRAFAKRANVTVIGVPGGGAAEEAIADEVSMGRLTVRTVPARIEELATRGAARPDGVLGLAFLLHFDATLDFRRSRLTLRRPGEPAAGVQAWIAGDRHLLIAGKVNGKFDTLIGLNSGLSGVIATPSEFFARASGEPVRDIAAGPLLVTKAPLSPGAFPLGLDGSFGVPVAAVLGPGALRGRTLRLEPRSMRVEIQ